MDRTLGSVGVLCNLIKLASYLRWRSEVGFYKLDRSKPCRDTIYAKDMETKKRATRKKEDDTRR